MDDETLLLIAAGVGIYLLTTGDLGKGVKKTVTGVGGVFNGTGDVLVEVGETLSTGAAIYHDSGLFLNWFPSVLGVGPKQASLNLLRDWKYF
jgi:hypothetical protein